MFAAPVADARCVDLSLVLAIDNSSSIDEREHALQVEAIAASFRDPVVLAAIEQAGLVAVAAVFWGDVAFPSHRTDWFLVEGADDAEFFAASLARHARQVFGNTDLGGGVWAALDMLSAGVCAARSVINLSGDGKETVTPKRLRQATLRQARKRAEEMGVTINALAIPDQENVDIADYYARNLITGPDAFVVSLNDHSNAIEAMRKKLHREIAPRMLSDRKGPIADGDRRLRQ
jgi:hypothetical protein